MTKRTYIPEAAKRMHIGINFSMPFEAGLDDERTDYSWGWNERFYRMTKVKGFDHVRLPIVFSNYLEEPNGEAILYDRLDKAVEAAMQNGLTLILDCHGYGCRAYGDIISNYAPNKAGFLDMWETVAKRYKNCGDRLMFELLNEPTRSISVPDLDDLQASAVEVIRKHCKDNVIVLGCRCSNLPEVLNEITVPDDKDIIIDIHNYAPKAFTHQPLFNYKTPVSFDNMMKCDTLEQFDYASQYMEETGIQLWLGEFGCYQVSISHLDSAKYADFMKKECDKRGFPFAWWDFCHGFSAYSKRQHDFKPYIADILVDNDLRLADFE